MKHFHSSINGRGFRVISLADHFQRLLDRLAVVAMLCQARGGGFDDFYREYLTPGGSCTRLNPFRDRYGHFSQSQMFQALRACGYGDVPELSANVFWQESTDTVWESCALGD